MMSNKYQVGDRVVFAVSKRSTRPGPRAKGIVPAAQGDSYSYTVDKFWMVVSVEDDELTLVTRTGKEHRISAAHH